MNIYFINGCTHTRDFLCSFMALICVLMAFFTNTLVVITSLSLRLSVMAILTAIRCKYAYIEGIAISYRHTTAFVQLKTESEKN